MHTRIYWIIYVFEFLFWLMYLHLQNNTRNNSKGQEIILPVLDFVKNKFSKLIQVCDLISHPNLSSKLFAPHPTCFFQAIPEQREDEHKIIGLR